eukprot:1640194-Prymnesium_polylepis.1
MNVRIRKHARPGGLSNISPDDLKAAPRSRARALAPSQKARKLRSEMAPRPKPGHGRGCHASWRSRPEG